MTIIDEMKNITEALSSDSFDDVVTKSHTLYSHILNARDKYLNDLLKEYEEKFPKFANSCSMKASFKATILPPDDRKINKMIDAGEKVKPFKINEKSKKDSHIFDCKGTFYAKSPKSGVAKISFDITITVTMDKDEYDVNKDEYRAIIKEIFPKLLYKPVDADGEDSFEPISIEFE